MSSLNPLSRLYRETPCPTHGGFHEPIEGKCLGGSREEVTIDIDYEAAVYVDAARRTKKEIASIELAGGA